jgi:uncharacterized protein (TIGR00255 family)
MTGYGRGAAERAGYSAVAEIRSVNHRYTDFKLRGSPLDPGLEEQVAGSVRARIERGALIVSVNVRSHRGGAGVRIDLGAARRVYQALTELAAELRLPGTVDLALVCAQPGVVLPADDPGDTDALAACVLAAVDQAIDALIAMREAEGAALARDLSTRLDRLAHIVDELERLASGAPAEAHSRLHSRLERLLAQVKLDVDRDRLAQEVAILADRHDVSEELVRLRSHVVQTRSAMAGDPRAVGRQLGFLVQELGRELNTVGAKSQSADVARLVVEAKAELEKMREQVQNVE